MIIKALFRKSWRGIVVVITFVLTLNLLKARAEETSFQLINEGRALSLRVLEENVRGSFKREKQLDKELSSLAGLNKIYGFVIDREGRDCIIIGKTDPHSPPILLDDLVIAIKNRWKEMSPPGCSIDPRQEDLVRIQKLANELMGIQDPILLRKKLPSWKNISGSQDVRVFGVPMNTHFAKIMVEADYLLKRIIDGSYPLNIKGFKSFSDIMVEEVKKRLKVGEISLPPLQMAMRFWFYPRENKFIEDEGIVLIEKCTVKLLTEEEFLTKTGKIVSSGRANPMGEDFVDLFTKFYSEIARVEPIYKSLENLFWIVALSGLLKERRAPEMAGLNFDYWINDFPIKEFKIPSILPYITNIKEINFEMRVSGVSMLAYLCIPSCGGVSIDIKIQRRDTKRDRTGALLKLKNAILNSRPSSKTLFWDFKVEGVPSKRDFWARTLSKEAKSRYIRRTALEKASYDSSIYDRRR